MNKISIAIPVYNSAKSIDSLLSQIHHLALYFIILHFLGVIEPEGWRSLIVSVLFIGGVQLLALGVIGEYVGRAFLYQSKEPQFIIEDIKKVINAKKFGSEQ